MEPEEDLERACKYIGMTDLQVAGTRGLMTLARLNELEECDRSASEMSPSEFGEWLEARKKELLEEQRKNMDRINASKKSEHQPSKIQYSRSHRPPRSK